jgi:RimJ/RimL family protein N-acetyltransferase
MVVGGLSLTMLLNYETCLALNHADTNAGRDEARGADDEDVESDVAGSTALPGKVLLVPYRPEHVAAYHEWMCDPLLLQATASEPLSLHEEYEMQETWRADPRKCTFIVLDASAIRAGFRATDSTLPASFIGETIPSMIGDVNLFLSPYSDEEDSAVVDSPDQEQQLWQGEIDIMIANPTNRRRGCGFEAVLLMLWYAVTQIKDIARFYCKIHETNVASIHLFRHRLQFVPCGYAACFQEHEFELKGSADVLRQHVRRLLLHYRESIHPTQSTSPLRRNDCLDFNVSNTTIRNCRTAGSDGDYDQLVKMHHCPLSPEEIEVP